MASVATVAVQPAQLPRGVVMVRPGLYCGPDEATTRMARDFGCVAVVSCAEQESASDRSVRGLGVHVLRIPLEDSSDSDPTEFASKVADFVRGVVGDEDEAEEDDGDDKHGADAGDAVPKSEAPAAETALDAVPEAATSAPPAAAQPMRPAVFVHCHAGTSRSPSLAIAAAMLMDSRTLSDVWGGMTASAPQHRVRPHPAFMYRLVHLDQQLHEGKTDFDLTAFFLTSLRELFPHASEEQVREAYRNAGGDVGAARNTLMRMHASAFVDKDKIMIDLLVKAVSHQMIPRRIVEQVYRECGQSRDKALLRLLQMQPEEIVGMMTSEDAAAAMA